MSKEFGILYAILLLFSASGSSQSRPIFFLEYSVNTSFIKKLSVNEDSKTGQLFGMRIDIPASESSDFTIGAGFMNMGSKKEVANQKKVKHFNYFTFSFGQKFYSKNVFITPETGLGIFLYRSIDYFQGDEKLRSETFFNREITSQIKARSSSIFLSVTLGYELDVNQNVLLIGSKNYFFIQPFARRSNGDKFFPFGLGLYLAYGFGKR